jgi:F420-dependent oxidoreductase-like protein
MQFSAWPNVSGPYDQLIDLCQHVERTGWDGIWIADHFMPNAADNSGPTGEVFTTLAGIAASVPRVRLGTLVVGNTYRHPPVVAKMAAQIDVISEGRFVLGLGAGWQENEHEAYGIPYQTVGGRLGRLEESVQIIRSLLHEERTTFEGRYYTVTDAPLAPKPVGRLPILIGGGGEQKTLRIAARFADEWNVWGSPNTLARKGAVLEQHCEEVGRDPSEIRRSAQALLVITDDTAEAERARQGGRPALAGSVNEIVETLGRYAEAGVDEWIVPNFGMQSSQSKEMFDRFIQDIAAQVR